MGGHKASQQPAFFSQPAAVLVAVGRTPLPLPPSSYSFPRGSARKAPAPARGRRVRGQHLGELRNQPAARVPRALPLRPVHGAGPSASLPFLGGFRTECGLFRKRDCLALQCFFLAHRRGIILVQMVSTPASGRGPKDPVGKGRLVEPRGSWLRSTRGGC